MWGALNWLVFEKTPSLIAGGLLMKLFEGVIAMLNSIIHGDCLEVLMTLEDNSIRSL